MYCVNTSVLCAAGCRAVPKSGALSLAHWRVLPELTQDRPMQVQSSNCSRSFDKKKKKQRSQKLLFIYTVLVIQWNLFNRDRNRCHDTLGSRFRRSLWSAIRYPLIVQPAFRSPRNVRVPRFVCAPLSCQPCDRMQCRYSARTSGSLVVPSLAGGVVKGAWLKHHGIQHVSKLQMLDRVGDK